MFHARFCIGAILIVTCASPTLAASNQGGSGADAGWSACLDWCDAHNKTPKSKGICFQNCTKYYRKHPKPFVGVFPTPSDTGAPIQSVKPPTGVLQDGDL